MERTFLLALEQQLTRMEVSARAELIQNQRRENMLKIWSSMKSSSVTKYSPDHYHLVKVNNGLSLTIMTLTHMEEEVQQVDFEVDLAKPPNPVLVQFLSSNLCREMQFCHGIEEERLLLTNIEISQVLIERLGGSIRVRSRSCLGTVDDTTSDDSNLTNGGTKIILANGNKAPLICQECQMLLGPTGGDGVKRELIESCPDFPGHLAEEDLQDDLDQPDHIDQGYPSLEDLVYEKEDVAKEEIKKILSKVDERKKGGRKPIKKKNNEELDEDGNEWNGAAEDDTDRGETARKKFNKRSSRIFCCPDTNCGATFAKEVAQMSHILKYHPTDYIKVTEGWVKCTELDCFHVYREGVPHYTKHLINHLKSCHPDSPVLLKETGQKNECSYCGKIFKYNYSLKKHVETLHEAPTVPCHICGILLKGQKTLSTHLKSVHEKMVRHHCPEPGCTMTAVNSHHLKDHIAVVHRGQARYVCSVCGKEHGYYKALKHCQDRHKGRFMHPCTLCDKKYLDKVKLTVHMRVHTGEKPYACPICATRMARLDNLSAHIKKTHGVTWQDAEKMTNTSVKGGPLVQKSSLDVG